MELQRSHIIGISVGLSIIAVAFFLTGTKIFFLLTGIGFLTILAPFVFGIIRETKINLEKEEMFLEFSRNLVESVKTGTPISRSIVNVKNKGYGVLGPHISKSISIIGAATTTLI